MKIHFKDFVAEMTMKAGDLEPHLRRSFDYLLTFDDDELVHIGDIDDVKVMKTRVADYDVHLLVKGSDRIGYMLGRLQPDMLMIEEWYVVSTERRKNLGEKYLYFLKNTLHLKVLMGNVHSTATQAFLKKLALHKRFELSWYNVDTKQTKPFDQETYELTKPSKWQVLIESDDIAVFNTFNAGFPSIKNTYEWLFQDIDKL